MFTEHCSGRRGTVNTRLFEGTCEIWFFPQICVHKMWLGSDLYLYFIHTFCKDCNWMFHSVVLLSPFYFLNASECFASSAHEPSLLDDDKSVCKEPMFRRVFPLKVGLQRSVILLKWDAGCSHCTLLHFIIEYSTITPIANYYRLFQCCSLLHTIEMRCTPCNANRICFITPNILNFWPTFRITFRTNIKCTLDFFTKIKFCKLLFHSADSWSWGQWKLMLENMFCPKITPFLTSCFERDIIWAFLVVSS